MRKGMREVLHIPETKVLVIKDRLGVACKMPSAMVHQTDAVAPTEPPDTKKPAACEQTAGTD